MDAGEYLCVGVGSLQENNKHAIFLDLDNHTEAESINVARFLINNKAISDCYIVQSSKNNHHLVCFDLVSFNKAHEIAFQFGHPAWAKFRGYAKDFVLRITPKLLPEGKELKPVSDTEPVLKAIVKSPFNFNKKSEGLRLLFSAKWGINIAKDEQFIGNPSAKIHVYRLRMKED